MDAGPAGRVSRAATRGRPGVGVQRGGPGHPASGPLAAGDVGDPAGGPVRRAARRRRARPGRPRRSRVAPGGPGVGATAAGPIAPPGAGRVDPALLDHVAATVRRALRERAGDVLVFLPGAGEIAAVAGRLADLRDTVAVLPLHGRLSGSAQDAALAPPSGRGTAHPGTVRRRVVLATAVAESSLTVPGGAGGGGRRAEPGTAHRPGPRAGRAGHRAGVPGGGHPTGRPGRAGGAGCGLPLLVGGDARPARPAARTGDRHRRPDRVRAGAGRLGHVGRQRPGAARSAAAGRAGRGPGDPGHARRGRRRRPDHVPGAGDRVGRRPSPVGPGVARRRAAGRRRPGGRGGGGARRRVVGRRGGRPAGPVAPAARRHRPGRHRPVAGRGTPAARRPARPHRRQPAGDRSADRPTTAPARPETSAAGRNSPDRQPAAGRSACRTIWPRGCWPAWRTRNGWPGCGGPAGPRT